MIFVGDQSDIELITFLIEKKAHEKGNGRRKLIEMV